MKGRMTAFKTGILHFLTIPEPIRREYWQDTLRKNHLSLLVICFIIFLAETYNIIRVLFLSPSGLGTLNNRIYFGMYCTLLAAAILWQLLQPALGRAPLRLQWTAQYVTILVIFLWHILLNTYDLSKNPSGSIVVFTTAILGLAVFVQMPCPFSILGFGSGFLLFAFLAAPFLSAGTVTNLGITFLVSLSVSLTNSHHAAVQLQQRRELVRMNARLQELVKRDPLTGLLNKTALTDQIAHCLAHIPETGGSALFLLDLDDFKSINDNFGHPCGDLMLKTFAKELETVFSDACGIGRIGGDEFAVILHRGVSKKAALEMGARLTKLPAPAPFRDNLPFIGCSIGICTCRRPGISCEQFYQEADRALYQAKRRGKSQCAFLTLPL